MKNTILSKLEEIEEKEKVHIIHAVESGSRAWGFESPDSDYDVRFIYVRPAEYYLRLDDTRDVIEWQLDETLDINGWDIQKMLRLLYKSNPTVFEWNNSPIVYKTTPQWQKISSVINDYFISKHGIYHYLSTAKGNYREYLKGEEVRLKKYFYVLRPLLACRWIIDRDCPPPMLFEELTAAYLPQDIRPAVDSLLEIKMHSPETKTGKRIKELNDYIEKSFEEMEAIAASASDRSDRSWDTLNRVFLETIGL